MSTKAVIWIIVIAIVAVIAYWLIPQPSAAPAAPADMTATTTSAGTPPPAGATSTQPVAVAAARAALAEKLTVDEKTITTAKVEAMTWSDGCLGLGGAAESCLQALVDGYRVTLTASGKTYVYRTDTSGASVRLESK
jgi:hypothetical protein